MLVADLQTNLWEAGFATDRNKEHALLGNKAVYFGESPTLRRNISPPSSTSKSRPSKKQGKAGGKLTVVSLFREVALLRVVVRLHVQMFNALLRS
jgi:hypothetical protein